MTDTIEGFLRPNPRRRHHMTAFHLRRFYATIGPFPVLMQRMDAVQPSDRRTWFNRDRARKREFEIFYGYNPRCFHQGTWEKPGHRWQERCRGNA